MLPSPMVMSYFNCLLSIPWVGSHSCPRVMGMTKRTTLNAGQWRRQQFINPMYSHPGGRRLCPPSVTTQAVLGSGVTTREVGLPDQGDEVTSFPQEDVIGLFE